MKENLSAWAKLLCRQTAKVFVKSNSILIQSFNDNLCIEKFSISWLVDTKSYTQISATEKYIVRTVVWDFNFLPITVTISKFLLQYGWNIFFFLLFWMWTICVLLNESFSSPTSFRIINAKICIKLVNILLRDDAK